MISFLMPQFYSSIFNNTSDIFDLIISTEETSFVFDILISNKCLFTIFIEILL